MLCLNILRMRDGRLIFASGQDNHAAGLTKLRSEFLALSGPIPHLPQWAFGLWFTWYHPYNQSEKTAEVQRFIDDDLGLDVSSSDKTRMRVRCLLRWYAFRPNSDVAFKPRRTVILRLSSITFPSSYLSEHSPSTDDIPRKSLVSI